MIKYHSPNTSQELIDRLSPIKEYLDTLGLDKRKIAVGFDNMIWFFDMFSRQSSNWVEAKSSVYGDGPQEKTFLLKKPATVLMASPAWNTNLTKLMNDNSTLTLLNGHQLDLFEEFIKNDSDGWNYSTVTRQQTESSSVGPYEMICINVFDIVHNPELVQAYYDMLAPGGVLTISYANDNGNLYELGAEYSPYYEINQILKNNEDAVIYHDYTTVGTTIAIKSDI